jgi:hypothetical protein
MSDFVEVGGKKIDQAEDLKARGVANPSMIALCMFILHGFLLTDGKCNPGHVYIYIYVYIYIVYILLYL